MTLIAGIVCRDAIVVVADSQVSYGQLKLPNSNKINVVGFPHRKVALIAESGEVGLSNRILDAIKVRAASADIRDENAIPLTVQAAVMQVRAEEMGLDPRCPTRPPSGTSIFRPVKPSCFLAVFIIISRIFTPFPSMPAPQRRRAIILPSRAAAIALGITFCANIQQPI